MTLKELAKQLDTAIQTVPNLVKVLKDGLDQAEVDGDVEYSATEKKIGKWTDGSDLYQITIEKTTENNNTYQNIYKIPDDVNIKEINAAYESGTGEIITGAWVNGNILYECAVANTLTSPAEKYLMVRRITSDAGWATVKFTCTLKYTKTAS